MRKINFFQLLLVVMLFVSATAHGQWTSVPTAGIDGTCNVSRVFADGNDLYAYVSNGGLYKSTDGGENWVLFNDGLPAGVEIRAIAASGSKVYAAANKNGIYESEKTTAAFTKLGTVPVLSNDFSALAAIDGVLYLGINGKGVYKCVISTATYTQLTSGLANNASVTSLAVDEIGGVKRLYAGVNADNGFFVKNAADDTWVKKTINNETVSGNMARISSLYANNGKIIIGGNTVARGLVYVGTTTDFSTYTFVKADTTLYSNTINDIAFDGQHIYLATSALGVLKSNDISSGTIRYTQLINGLQTPRANTAKIVRTIDGKMLVAQNTGGFVSNDNGASWARKLNEKFTTATITGIKENDGKLYATTSSGIYESASGNGGDWVKFGNGLNSSVSAKGLSFGTLGTYAVSDGALFKLNGNNWEPVIIDQPGLAWDHPRGSQMQDIEQFSNGVKTCLFGSGWRASGIYRYDGTNWDLYTTTTVNDVTTEMTGDADNGLTWSTADSTQTIIASKFLYDAESNTLMCHGKNTIQYSHDFGDTWKWRMENHNIRLNQGNIRALSLKKEGTTTFLYTGTDMTFGGAWSLAKNEIGTTPENVGGNWSNISSATGNNETRDVITWDNSPIIVMRTTNSSGAYVAIRVSTDDGLSGKVFETGLANKTAVANLSKVGNYVYAGSTANEIERYNVMAVPSFTGDAPAVSNITSSGASLEATSTLPGIIYAVVGAKNATAPSAAQIVAGKDAADATAPAANIAVLANVKATVNVAELSATTDYTLYTVVVSETGITSAVTAIDFATTVSTSINEIKTAISVSPNPTKGILRLNKAINSYKLYNLQGLEVLSGHGAVNQIDLNNQPNGIYVLKIENSFIKVVKE